MSDVASVSSADGPPRPIHTVYDSFPVDPPGLRTGRSSTTSTDYDLSSDYHMDKSDYHIAKDSGRDSDYTVAKAGDFQMAQDSFHVDKDTAQPPTASSQDSRTDSRRQSSQSAGNCAESSELPGQPPRMSRRRSDPTFGVPSVNALLEDYEIPLDSPRSQDMHI